MLMISSRKYFFNPEEHSPTIQFAKVNPDGNFSKDFSPSIDVLKNKRILVLVHEPIQIKSYFW